MDRRYRFLQFFGRVMQAVDNRRSVLLQQRLSAPGVRQHGRISSPEGPTTSTW